MNWPLGARVERGATQTAKAVGLFAGCMVLSRRFESVLERASLPVPFPRLICPCVRVFIPLVPKCELAWRVRGRFYDQAGQSQFPAQLRENFRLSQGPNNSQQRQEARRHMILMPARSCLRFGGHPVIRLLAPVSSSKVFAFTRVIWNLN